ncbi:hypothetical protein INT45_001324 [Circinella minor]|uniref:RRM domain-containing protein n=1 Tax=Circinella minor TaxID=1195481 RepID=A0A8H7S9S3_9FUNG|nr:hypothetical protein INT45_001324 [Circinella minor]
MYDPALTDYIRTTVIGDHEERMSINSQPSSRNSTTPATPTGGTFFNNSPNACRPYQQQQQQYSHYPQQPHSQQQPPQGSRPMMTPPLSQYSLFPPPSSWDWFGLPKSVSGGTSASHTSSVTSEVSQARYLLTPPPYYPCAKLTNIPWDVSQNDIRNFFGHCRLPSISIQAQSIHIMMDRTTGKTLSDAYVEFASQADLTRAIETRHQKPLKGRVITVTECTQEELLLVVFPKWRGQFCGVSAIPPPSQVVKSMSTAAGGGGTQCPPFVTREEINALLVVCKNYKLHFSRKCAERPFENIISVITKYPWHQVHLISTMHRDHIYEMLKLSIESLKTHLSKDYVQIDSTLLERVTRAGIMCPAFTERQKMTLLQTARIECTPDLFQYLLPSASSHPSPSLIPEPYYQKESFLQKV